MELGKSKRVYYLDELRGFAILLVIIGHLIQRNYTGGLSNPVFNIIYSFHMPLFFFLSGCTYALSQKTEILTLEEWGKTITRKTKQLLIPYMSWTLLLSIADYPKFSPFLHLHDYWFLYTLFAVFLFWSFFISNETIRKYKIIAFPLLAVMFTIAILYGYKRITIMYFLMFIIGYAFQKYYVIYKINVLETIILVAGFVLLVGKFKYGDNVSGDPSRVWLEFPISMIASFALIKIFSLFPAKLTLLRALGLNSLGIYLLHLLFVNIPYVKYIETCGSHIIQVLLLFIASVGLAILCTCIIKLVKLNKWTSFLLLGT